MMDAFRKFGASKASKALLVVLMICFGAWGIGGYLSPSLGMQAFTVNGEDVSPRLVQQTYEQRLQNVAQLLGGKPTPEQIEQMQMPEQIVAEVVARTVLRQTAEHLGFQPATNQLKAEIRGISAFKDESGKFDAARYRQILAQIGRTPEQFEKDLGQDLTVRNLARLGRLETPSPSLVAGIAGAENVKLTFEVATLKPEMATNLPAPSDAALQEFYTKNQSLYGKEETRTLHVLRISRDELISSITVPEAEIQKAYEENKQHYTLPETRLVRHILVDSKDEAAKLASSITSLENFEKAAAAHSLDTANKDKGGSLGTIKPDDVVEPFRTIAFQLPEGKLSEPVQTNYGWHLVWVEKINAPKHMSLEEMHDAIAKDLQSAQADDAVTRLGNTVDEKIAAGLPLPQIGKEAGLKVLTFSSVRAGDESVEAQERSVGFGLNQGEVSSPVQLKDGGVTYVQAEKITPASTEPFAQVKARVEADWKKAQANMALRRMADGILSAARAPNTAQQSLAASAAKAGVTLATQTLTVSAPAEAPDWLQRNLLEFYPLAAGTTLAGALPEGTNLHLVRLTARESLPLDVTQLPEIAKVYQQRLQGDVEALLMAHLTQNAKVKLNQPQLKQIFGRNVQWSTQTN